MAKPAARIDGRSGPAGKRRRPLPTLTEGGGEGRLDRMAVALAEVRAGTRASPRTSKLFAAGGAKIAQKVIEEAAEVGIDAVRGDRVAVVNESVDLIYNLSVLWASMDIPPAVIWREMDRREALLGMAEKLPKAKRGRADYAGPSKDDVEVVAPSEAPETPAPLNEDA